MVCLCVSSIACSCSCPTVAPSVQVMLTASVLGLEPIYKIILLFMLQKSNLSGKVLPTIIGDNVTVGHSAVLHGCTVEDEAFVGAGATLLDGVCVEKNAMVAAGALVRQNTRIPCGEVCGEAIQLSS
ncbi:hypothetical protein OIU78_020535 [Salix suchowensis]|nr:hypothetical protein OIU78_020535 [Salix suchowensis]